MFVLIETIWKWHWGWNRRFPFVGCWVPHDVVPLEEYKRLTNPVLELTLDRSLAKVLLETVLTVMDAGRGLDHRAVALAVRIVKCFDFDFPDLRGTYGLEPYGTELSQALHRWFGSSDETHFCVDVDGRFMDTIWVPNGCDVITFIKRELGHKLPPLILKTVVMNTSVNFVTEAL